jgi:hypothetical protein
MDLATDLEKETDSDSVMETEMGWEMAKVMGTEMG